jgi:heat shock protein HtpX
MTNSIKTVLLLGLLTGVLLLGGELIAGQNGLYMGLAFAVVVNFSTYFFSDKIALATYSAQLVTPEQNPAVYHRVAPIVENLARRMNLPMPKLYVIPEPSPNAFATGRNPSHASVAFTSGILELMTDQELDGVIAHELGHVLHRDILISSIAATLAGAIMFASRLGFFFGGSDDRDREGGAVGAILMMILAPFAALLIQMAISRSREYEADAASAKYTGTPHELISGLQKLETWSKRIPMQATPSTAHMFIVEPASRSWLRNLWSTHPSTEDRIRRLQEMR